MQLDDALEQISEIHAQVLKSEVFRGYRAVTMSLTAVVAVVAAIVQPVILGVTTPLGFVWYWVCVAALCATLCAVDILRSMRLSGESGQGARTVLVVLQSLPALLVGAVATAILVHREGAACALPGLWAMFFALGIWSARPYLPRAVGMVALFYVFAGTWQISQADAALMPSPWGMGLTFGVGQCALAVVLYLNIERGVHVVTRRKEQGHG